MPLVPQLIDELIDEVCEAVRLLSAVARGSKGNSDAPPWPQQPLEPSRRRLRCAREPGVLCRRRPGTLRPW